MTSKIAVQQPAGTANTPEGECPNCRTRKFVSDLMECTTQIDYCKWALPYGDTRFCTHTSAKMFDESNKP